MNTPNVDAGRLERRVRRVCRETMPGIQGFCPFHHSAEPVYGSAYGLRHTSTGHGGREFDGPSFLLSQAIPL